MTQQRQQQWQRVSSVREGSDPAAVFEVKRRRSEKKCPYVRWAGSQAIEQFQAAPPSQRCDAASYLEARQVVATSM